MGGKMDDTHFQEMFISYKKGNFNVNAVSTKDLEGWLNHVDTPDQSIQLLARKIEYELQRRQLSESIKWQMWMAIATAIMATGTVILAVITYLKS